MFFRYVCFAGLGCVCASASVASYDFFTKTGKWGFILGATLAALLTVYFFTKVFK